MSRRLFLGAPVKQNNVSSLTCVGEEDGLRVGFWCGRGANEDMT
jgi:hypothetical protein